MVLFRLSWLIFLNYTRSTWFLHSSIIEANHPGTRQNHIKARSTSIMSTPESSRRDHPNTYVVQDHSNEAERTRLRFQDQMLTTSMGGVLSEQPDPTRFQRILDVGCGTGVWLIEAARTYPEMSLLVGVDISRHMIEYASSLSEQQQVSERVQF